MKYAQAFYAIGTAIIVWPMMHFHASELVIVQTMIVFSTLTLLGELRHD